MVVVERHNIKGTPEIVRLCTVSKELFNKCNYFMRKAWFTRKPLPNIVTLVAAVQGEDCFKNLHNTKTAKQTIRKVLTDWTNFKKALSAYKKDSSKFFRKPKPPHYKEKLAQVIFYRETIAKKPLKKGIITPTNGCFSILSDRPFKQVVITPKTFGFVVEVQYETEDKPKEKASKKRICCIDIGLNNLAAITSDQHKPILVNGRILKSINQWYNKHPSKTNSRKRYFRLENYFHHVSKMIVDNCVKHGIGKIIIGKNDGWKNGINLGKKTNQAFCAVPTYLLLEKIKYKALMAGVEVIFTEEAYTSKASYFDRDPLPKWEQDMPEPTISGKRVKRGLYRAGDGRLLNADVNGSANIGRKVIGNNDEILVRLDRSLAARPVVVNPLRKPNGEGWVVDGSNLKTSVF
jgi:IS605 OrfB family transposase